MQGSLLFLWTQYSRSSIVCIHCYGEGKIASILFVFNWDVCYIQLVDVDPDSNTVNELMVLQRCRRRIGRNRPRLHIEQG